MKATLPFATNTIVRDRMKCHMLDAESIGQNVNNALVNSNTLFSYDMHSEWDVFFNVSHHNKVLNNFISDPKVFRMESEEGC